MKVVELLIFLAACVLANCNYLELCVKGPAWASQGVTDAQCQNCGGNGTPGSCWWPCTTCGLCSESCNAKCGKDPCGPHGPPSTTTLAPTPAPTTPPTTLPAATVAEIAPAAFTSLPAATTIAPAIPVPTSAPASTLPPVATPDAANLCVKGPAWESQGVTDQHCQNCGGYPRNCWWPCTTCGLCSDGCNAKCGKDPCNPQGPPITTTLVPTPPAPTPPAPTPAPTTLPTSTVADTGPVATTSLPAATTLESAAPVSTTSASATLPVPGVSIPTDAANLCVKGPAWESQGVTDQHCQNCGGLPGNCWWPCTTCGLCSEGCNAKCGKDPCNPQGPPVTTTLAPTPTPTPPAPTPAPTTFPATTVAEIDPVATTSLPAATTLAPTTFRTTTVAETTSPPAGVCRAGPRAATQSVTDEHCQSCSAGDGSVCWWPCSICGLCSVECTEKCGTDPCGGHPPPPPSPETPPPEATTTAATGGGEEEGGGEGGHEGLCSPQSPQCTYTPGQGIAAWFTEEMFNEMFPQRCSSGCQGCSMLIYDCLIQAAQEYSDTFANSGDVDTDRRELAAWLGIMSQETTGGGCHSPVSVDANGDCGECAGVPPSGKEWCHSTLNGGCYAWGLCFVEEQGGSGYCSPSSKYPCQPGKSYSGRGPKQLSWNYNYGQFSEQACGEKMVLLENPEWVASNSRLAWSSSIWFWMTGGACNPELGEICKPSPHSVIVGSKTMCPADLSANREYGLGWATNIVNGGLECGGAQTKCDYRVHSRVEFYKRFASILGVNHLAPGWADGSLYCSHQKNYGESPPTSC